MGFKSLCREFCDAANDSLNRVFSRAAEWRDDFQDSVYKIAVDIGFLPQAELATVAVPTSPIRNLGSPENM